MTELSLSRSQMLLLSGTANRPLAEEVAGHLGQPLCAVTIRRFAAGELFRKIAEDVYCCATHALLSGPAVERLTASPVKEVAVTNTIALPAERRFDRLKVLSIAGLLSKAIGYTHSDQSVSSLFD